MNSANSLLKVFLKYYEKVLCNIIVFIATPCFFIFEMNVVRPNLIEIYHLGIVKQYLHIICPTFCFVNVTGNMIMSILTDTSLKRSHEDGTYCEQCKMYRPLESWHCNECNACIIRRDHHCFFFSRCIGLYNQRYYVMYLGYIMISMAYSAYYNYFFVSSKFDEFGLLVSVLRILNPLLRFMVPEPMGMRDLYVLFFVTNVGLLIWSFSLFFFHTSNVFKGVTARESTTVCLRCLDLSKWKENMVKVFGVRWYLAIIFPFVYSPSPETLKLE